MDDKPTLIEVIGDGAAKDERHAAELRALTEQVQAMGVQVDGLNTSVGKHTAVIEERNRIRAAELAAAEAATSRRWRALKDAAAHPAVTGVLMAISALLVGYIASQQFAAEDNHGSHPAHEAPAPHPSDPPAPGG